MKRCSVFTMFFIGAPVLLAARVLQQLYMMDTVTGFYQDGFSGIGTAITALYFVFAAVIIILVNLSADGQVTAPKKNVGLAVCSFFSSACLIVSAATDIIKSNSKIDTVIAVMSFAAAFTIAWYGVALIADMEYPPVATLVPIAYTAVRLILTFMSYTGEVAVTDTAFDIAAMCFLLLFFYTNGKLISRAGTKRTPSLMFAYGLCAALFCADSILARIIVSVTGVALIHSTGFDASYIGFAVYTVASVLAFSSAADRESEE